MKISHFNSLYSLYIPHSSCPALPLQRLGALSTIKALFLFFVPIQFLSPFTPTPLTSLPSLHLLLAIPLKTEPSFLLSIFYFSLFIFGISHVRATIQYWNCVSNSFRLVFWSQGVSNDLKMPQIFFISLRCGDSFYIFV